ncbi:uncharacterized protein [Brachyistius frenatus]|uniref:uncharacterized protein isoform X1 n=1 Tax=Brachyistius frenatus TaxID=100188 RepID=UPI0037E936D4
MVAERYATLCDRSDTRGPEITQKFNISKLLAPDTPCVIVSSSVPKRSRSTRGDGTERKTRSKRAWILPGTLWCGSGSKAFGYEQLGMFESADRCCREHDHCLHIIPAFTLNYGVFNSNFFTVSHCECDQRFRQCLLDVDESISTMVGYSFFNILQVPCFELKLQKRCTKMYWWGMCRVAEEAPYAVFKKALPYNTSDFTHIYSDTDSNKLTSSEGQHVTKSPMITLHTKSVKTKQRCGFRDPPRGETFHRRRTKKRGCKRHQKLFGESPSQAPPISRGNATYLSMTTGLLNASKSSILISTKRRAGKKKGIRKGLSDYPTHRGRFPPQVNTNSDPQTSSMTPPSTLPLTQRPKLQLHPTRAVTAVTKTMRSPKKVPKQSRCYRSRQPVRGDTFQPHCKNCTGQEAGSHVTAVTPEKTNGLPIKLTTHETMHLKKTTEKPKEDSLISLWNTATFATPIITKLKTVASKPQKQVDSYLLWNNTSQEPMAITIDQSSHAESVKQKNALCKMTGEYMQVPHPFCWGLSKHKRPLLKARQN